MRYLLPLALVFLTLNLYATHNWGAYLTVTLNSGNNCRIQVVTVADPFSSAHRDSLQVYIKYNSANIDSLMIPKTNIVELDNQFQRNYYAIDYTFPGPGHYTLSLYEPNLTAGIVNMANSVTVPMYVETEIYLGPNFTQTVTFDSLTKRHVHSVTDTLFNHFHPSTNEQRVEFERVTPLQGQDVSVPEYNDMQSAIHPESGLFHFPVSAFAAEGPYLFAIEAKTYNNGHLTSRVHHSFVVALEKTPLTTGLQAISGFPEDTFTNSYEMYLEPGSSDTFEVRWTDNDTANDQDLWFYSPELHVEEAVISENDTIHHSRFIVYAGHGHQRLEPFFITFRGTASFQLPGDTNILHQSQDIALLVRTDNSTGITGSPVAPLTVHPNPVDKILKIKGNKDLDHFSIYSMEGKLIKSGKVREDQSIQVGNLTTGYYILYGMDRSGSGFKSKFYKQ